MVKGLLSAHCVTCWKNTKGKVTWKSIDCVQAAITDCVQAAITETTS